MRKTGAVRGTIVLLLLAVAGRAWGAGEEEAEAHLKKGVALRRARNDAGALQEFRRAYELRPDARAAAQMGLAEQQLKIWVDADRHLAEALRDHGDPWIKKNRAVLEQQRHTVATRVGRVVVGGEPVGAELFLNGQSAGTVPLREPATVAPGPVRVEVRSPGYTPSNMTVIVGAGDQSRLDVRLEREKVITPAPLATAPLPAPRPSTPPLLVPRPIASGGPLLEPTPEQPEAVERSAEPSTTSPGMRTARWVMLGATGVFLAAGITGLVVHEHEVGLFNKVSCRVDPSTGNVINGAKGASPGYCRMLVDNANTGRTVGIVGLAGAGLLAVTSAVLFLAF
jgi:hypothetical protein